MDRRQKRCCTWREKLWKCTLFGLEGQPTFKTVLSKFHYCSPKKNEPYERFAFLLKSVAESSDL
ncbi:hypothetical protein HPB48_023597 [Haemaphysalis longicornis]|uniref:Uncharacterized protein n=1 Tax=Haemaphysalis longicornis TaxID=44386 RepID=A0A9J6H7Q5_HAELO|nr:hypothetical protein HPB48_023597 [Haemaphysalis longicornis]